MAVCVASIQGGSTKNTNINTNINRNDNSGFSSIFNSLFSSLLNNQKGIHRTLKSNPATSPVLVESESLLPIGDDEQEDQIPTADVEGNSGEHDDAGPSSKAEETTADLVPEMSAEQIRMIKTLIDAQAHQMM